MNVNSCSSFVTVALGLLRRGSGALYGGLSAVPGRGRGYFGAERRRVGRNASFGIVTRISDDI